MLSLIFFASLLPCAISSYSFASGLVTKDCMQCLCEVESQCTAADCALDQGTLRCGYFQIKQDYWIDCGKPGLSWKSCSKDLNCSSSCVQGYMKRNFGKWCTEKKCETFVRMHNGGPQGCLNQATRLHWRKVLSCLV